MKNASLLVVFNLIAHLIFSQIQPIGSWRNHLSFSKIISVDTFNNKIIAGSNNGYFLFDPLKNEITTRTSINGLSDVSIRVFSKQPNGTNFLVAYENGNIDIINNGVTRNLPDIFLSKLTPEKTINAISWYNNLAFLSTNFGVVVVNPSKFEVVDTYFPSSIGGLIGVYQVAIIGSKIYAATENGIFSANYLPATLRDFRTWSPESTPFPNNYITSILQWGEALIAKRGDSLYSKINDNWNLFYPSTKTIHGITTSGNNLFVAETLNQVGNILSFTMPTSKPQFIQSLSITKANSIVSDGANLWIADDSNGLIKINNGAEQKIIPNGPAGIAKGLADFQKDVIAIPASEANAVNNSFINNQVYVLKEDQWKSYTPKIFSSLSSYADFNSVAIDPSSTTLYVGTLGTGLLSIDKDNKFNSFGAIKGGLQVDRSSLTSCKIGGLSFDNEMNLWMTNPNTDAPVVVKKKDGGWNNFIIPFSIEKNMLSKILVDSENRKWISTSNGKGLICFDDNNTIDQKNDDRWRYFLQGTGQGNLPSSNVLSMAEDQSGTIWVGTDRGIGIIQCGADIFSAAKCDASLPVVQQDNFAGLLLANEVVNDIKVDGADRKWVATKNGVWLLSADGQKVVYRFTNTNSKLLSNHVFSIVVHATTGEVFFMTAAGICSFRSTATKALEEIKKPFVFPNPVPSGYTGAIAIKELPNNAWVKITELDGRLVYQTRSLGGQAIWNGKNYKGERVNSGAYLIIVSNQDNTDQVAGKIFFIK